MGLQLVVAVDDTGQLNVNGPLHDKILCLGLLEAAKQAVLNYNPEAQPKIIPVKSFQDKPLSGTQPSSNANGPEQRPPLRRI